MHGLLLELHAYTLAARSYALLMQKQEIMEGNDMILERLQLTLNFHSSVVEGQKLPLFSHISFTMNIQSITNDIAINC